MRCSSSEEGASQESASTSASISDSTPEPPSPFFTGMSKFCRKCGSPVEMGLEDGSNWRHMCTVCDYIDYFNPKMVVGCVVEHEGKILLCKRAIEPCYGKWTIPAGFLELNESTTAGAARETWEEAAANVDIIAPYFHLDIPVIGQSYVLFRAHLAAPFTFGCGPETLDAELVDPNDIPFDDLAFSSVTITLKHYIEDMKRGEFHIHHAEIEKVKGSAPNDPHSFTLKNHMAFLLADSK